MPRCTTVLHSPLSSFIGDLRRRKARPASLRRQPKLEVELLEDRVALSVFSNPVAIASADVSIAKTGPASAVPMGTPITYTLTVSNAGPSDAQSVVVTDTVPSGATLNSMSFPQGSRGTGAASNTFNIGTVAAGATIAGTVVITPNQLGPSSDTASVGSSPSDPNVANNSSTATTTVTVAPFNGSGVPVNGNELSALTNVPVATFTHANGVEPASAFTATVTWGDGTSSGGQVTQASDGSYTVSGSHTYTDEKSWSITVNVSDPFSATAITTTGTVLEELLPDGTRGTADQRFVSEIYRDLLGRKVDAGGLAAWTAALSGRMSRFRLVSMIELSNEYRMVEVQALYGQYLHRTADAQGRHDSVNFLNNGGTVEQLAAILVNSPEHNGRTNGTNDGWLDVFYQDSLHRGVNSADRASADQTFAAGASRADVAAAVLSGDEYRHDLMQTFYLQFLDRAATGDPGSQGWFNVLKAGTRDETVIAAIISDSGTEFYNKVSMTGVRESLLPSTLWIQVSRHPDGQFVSLGTP